MSSHRHAPASNAARCGALLLFLALLLAPGARAVAPHLEITASADPTESVTAQLGLAGTSPSSAAVVWLYVKPAGGNGCAATAHADDGRRVIWEFVDAGPIAESANWRFDYAGTYLLCAWMQDETVTGQPIVATAAATVNIRLPRLALSVFASPVVDAGDAFTVSTTAQAEAERGVRVASVPDTGRGCPPSWGAARSTDGVSTIIDSWNVTGGPFTHARDMTYRYPGAYLICAYIVHFDTLVELASATAVDVRRPCTVPFLRRGTTLAVASARLRAAGCARGAIRRRRDPRVAAGRILAVRPAPGTRLPAGARVTVVMSKPHWR